MRQIGKRANRACFSDEMREQEREKSAHKMSQTFLQTAIKNCASSRVSSAAAQKTSVAGNRQKRNTTLNSADNTTILVSGMNTNR